MLATLNGKLLEVYSDEIVIDVNGVGYLVKPSLSVLSSLGKRGSNIFLQVYTDVKENDISLYGFKFRAEKEVFLLLKKVSGIGSKVALGIVSSIEVENILSSIGRGDVSSLTKVNGVGKKTAERIIVELREKVSDFLPKAKMKENKKDVSGDLSSFSAFSSEQGDALLALEKLGVSEDKARKSIEVSVGVLKEANKELTSGNLLKEALANL